MTPERYRRIREVLAARFADLTVLMEQVHKPHNLSAILRTCDAVGIGEAHAVQPTGSSLRVHPFTSAGSSKWVRVRTHPSTEDALAVIREAGFSIVVADPSPDAQAMTSFDFTAPVAVVVGAELHGLSSQAMRLADHRVAIPMKGMVGSLNVSVAAAVLLYEVLRQRQAAREYTPRRLSPESQERLAVEWAYPRVTALCRKDGTPYPTLDEDGFIVPA